MTSINAKNSAPANRKMPAALTNEKIKKRTELIGSFENITIKAERMIVAEKI